MPVCYAEDIEITLNVNERYTNISEMDEDDPFMSKTEETLQKERSKKIYITALVTLLVVAIGVLIYTLNKVPSEKQIEADDTKKILNDKKSDK
jgi:hypothetical protein